MNSGKILGKLPRKTKIPLQENGMATISKTKYFPVFYIKKDTLAGTKMLFSTPPVSFVVFYFSVGVRRCYYSILLWLNLPPKERRSSFKRTLDNSMSDDDSPRYTSNSYLGLD